MRFSEIGPDLPDELLVARDEGRVLFFGGAGVSRARAELPDLLHRAVPVVRTPDGLRALSKDRPISPASVERYLEAKFGDDLGPARRAMAKLARSLPRQEIAARAYRFYEEFRPEVPPGVKGWGAAGKLSLDLIETLAEH